MTSNKNPNLYNVLQKPNKSRKNKAQAHKKANVIVLMRVIKQQEIHNKIIEK